MVTVLINKHPVTLQFDSAPDITLISQQTWQRLGKPAPRKSNYSARNASGKHYRRVQLLCQHTINRTEHTNRYMYHHRRQRSRPIRARLDASFPNLGSTVHQDLQPTNHYTMTIGNIIDSIKASFVIAK